MSRTITLGQKRFYPSSSGGWLPSVTTIIDACFPKSKFLIDWQIEKGKEESERIKNEAADEGTVVHEMAEKLSKGEKINTEFLSDKQTMCLMKFAEWVEEYKPTFLETEQKVTHELLGYAGTIDIVCMIDGEVWVVDLKTSSAIHKSHHLQVTAYAEARGGVAKCGILCLNAKTRKGWAFKEVDMLSSWKLFDLCRRMFQLLYPDAKPKQIEVPDFIQLHNDNENSEQN